jgi:hypothetical protein
MRRFALLGLLFAPAAYGQQVVYDNTTTDQGVTMPLLPEWRDDSAEAGDEIWLTGDGLVATEIKLLFFYLGTAPGTIDLRLRFRHVDEVTETPSDVFYDTGVMPGVPTLGGMNEYTFSLPNVVVPQRFVWTVQAYNRQGSVGELGPRYFSPPTVGFSDDFFWLSDMGSEWTQYSWGGEPVANFGARLTAVPEPGSLCVLAFGAVLLWRRRR